MWPNEKPITMREFVDAMKRNGYPKIQGGFIKYADKNRKEVVGACAYGQAALNLGVKPGELLRRFQSATWRTTAPNVVLLNDTTDMSVTEIGEALEKWAENYNFMEKKI